MKYSVLFNLTLVILTVWTSGCAPILTPVEPTITFTPVPTVTSTPEKTSTPKLPLIETSTPTPESKYKLVNSVNDISAMSQLTLADAKPYSDWVHNTCVDSMSIDPTRIQFLINGYSDGSGFLAANIKDISKGYFAARNIQLCDRNTAIINPDQFGFRARNPALVIPYLIKDILGTVVVFKYVISQNGTMIMRDRGLFADKTGPHLAPMNKIHKSFSDVLGKGGGPDDISDIDIYKAQEISLDDINALFKRIESTSIINAEDKQMIESTYWTPIVAIAGAYSN